MKRLFATLTLAFVTLAVFAQSPEMFNYQGVARDNAGNVLANQPISLRISIQDGIGADLYIEDHSVTTNAFGLFNLNLGGGAPVSGSFTGISWGSDSHYVKVEMDPAGGATYVDMGTSQLLSVPYALYSASSGTGGLPGTTGADGADGATGSQGASGADGSDGVTGATGSQGASGADGSDGVTGATGSQGVSGADGATGPLIAGNEHETLRYNSTDWESNSTLVNTGTKVGVGDFSTLGPDAELLGELTVKRANSATDGVDGVFLDIVNASTNTSGTLAGIRFSNYNGQEFNPFFPGGIFWRSTGGSFGRGDIAFVTGTTGGPADVLTNTRMTITDNGNVGIGITAPSERFDVNGDLALSGASRSIMANGGAFNVSSSTGIDLIIDNDNNASNAALNIKRNGDGVEILMSVRESGNVGIGITTPSETLDIRSPGIDDPATLQVANSDESHFLRFFGGRDTDPNAHLLWKDGDPLRFATDAIGFDEKMRITSDGNVGIGTITPSSELHVAHGGGGSTRGLQIQRSGESNWRFYAGDNTVTFNLRLYRETNLLGEFDGTSGAYAAISDKRLKTNITGIGNVLEKVMNLGVKRYTFRSDENNTPNIGLIAQEANEYFPELVKHSNGDGEERYLMDYSGFGIIALKAIQEQQTIIDAQQKQINELIKIVNKLK